MDALAWMGEDVRFLVLGASSFYGTNFCALLKERGEDVQALSRPAWSLGAPIPDADCVVNFASSSLVAESWREPGAWLATNALDTTTLFNQAMALDIPRFVHVSTPEVYGHTPSAVREGHPFNPSTPYAVSRAAGDMMLMAYRRAYGFPAIITRTANIYGFGQPEHRFIPHAFKTLRKGMPLGLDGGGNPVRGWLHVRDACEATYLICLQGRKGETYHIAPKGIITVEALAKMICTQLGKPHGLLTHRADRLGKDIAYIMDSSKLRAMGWSERIPLKEGLAEYGN